MKKHLIIFLTALSLVSCRKQVADYETPEFEAKPILNAILTAGEPVWAQVSLAQGLNSVHTALCHDADVLFFVDGEYAEKLYYDWGTGLYKGNTIAECGKRYSCKVAVAGHDTLCASTNMPDIPRIKEVEIYEYGGITYDNESRPLFFVTFATDPTMLLYYQINIAGVLWQCNGWYSVRYSGVVTESHTNDDAVLLDSGTDYLIFNNSIISDTSYRMKINGEFNQIFMNLAEEQPVAEPLHGKIVVHMDGLSESLYKYLKSYYSYVENDAHDNLFLGVTTPFNYYSNVENGYGIFGARACYVSDTINYNEELRIRN